MFLSALAKTAESAENVWGLSLNVLITGVVVVFAVLLLLIMLIKLYSTIVYKAQNRAPKAPKSNDNGNDAKTSVINNNGAMAVSQPQGLTDELIAVITAAAVTAMGNSNIRVTGIRKRTSRSEWSDAALRENVQPFRMGDWK